MTALPLDRAVAGIDEDVSRSAVSWSAIIAGAFAASALSLALLALGASIGLGAVSPWSYTNPSAATFSVLAAAWLIAVELFASGLGGYLAGRLRTHWAGAHTDDVYFRDTVHGFLVWALGALLSAGLVVAAISGTLKAAANAAPQAASLTLQSGQALASATGNTGGGNALGYFTDMLFRNDKAATADLGATRDEVQRILVRGMALGDLAANDKTYVAALVAAKTGMSQDDAAKRVDDTLAEFKSAQQTAADKAKAVADTARKTGIYIGLWTFVALLVGAFSASYLATVGGRERDETTAGTFVQQ